MRTQVFANQCIDCTAVAVVKDGKVALAKGNGVRKLDEPAPVDEQTLFGIASNTKAFTAAALAFLVDEGKISWDDPVTKHLPGFQMYDPYVTREMTVRDLLTHRSGLGLGAGDLMFFPPTTFTREEIVARLRYIKPATSFRSKYAYDNVLWLQSRQPQRRAARNGVESAADPRPEARRCGAHESGSGRRDGSDRQSHH